jgi:hypothetical protein
MSESISALGPTSRPFVARRARPRVGVSALWLAGPSESISRDAQSAEAHTS